MGVMLAAEHGSLEVFLLFFPVAGQLFISSIVAGKVPPKLIDQNNVPKLLIGLESSLF